MTIKSTHFGHGGLQQIWGQARADVKAGGPVGPPVTELLRRYLSAFGGHSPCRVRVDLRLHWYAGVLAVVEHDVEHVVELVTRDSER